MPFLIPNLIHPGRIPPLLSSRILPLLTLASVVLFAQTAVACSCMAPPPPLEALTQMDHVFSGRVIATYDDPATGAIVATFQVYRSWKGTVGPFVVVHGGDDPAMCGAWFELDGEYLVYAWDTDGMPETNNCTRTRMIQVAAEDLEALGPPATVPTLRPSWSALKSNYLD